MNREALFCDGTGDYVCPAEPEINEKVVLRFRTAHNDVDEVKLHIGEQEYPMWKTRTNGEFDFYEIEYQLGEDILRYCFEIKQGAEICFYSRYGITGKKENYYDFIISPGFKTPEWAKGAVMYQIFVDRFCNGDPTNDVEDNEYIYIGAPSRKVKDWNQAPEAMDIRNFYGGDLQGVLDKLDYLQDLGVEVIYFNPLFVSPSNHKYDIQDYDYIDPHYGKIVVDDGEVLPVGAKDNIHATKYQQRTGDIRNLEASNQLFIKLVEEMHKRGMRVILDGVFNHCGSFNKWMDRERIYEPQPDYPKGAYVSKESPYNSFFLFHDARNELWPYNGTYDGWWGHDTLPKLDYEDSPQLEQYIMDIGRKWVSPPYNVDGWRLDVAADLGFSNEYNHIFWKRFRKEVKDANPDAIILAEHYGDPQDWLQGDEWDSVMNYDAFMEPLTWFLTGMEKHSDSRRDDLYGNAEAFKNSMIYNMAHMPGPSLQTAMNELSNHDHSRFLTRTNRRVGRMNTLGSDAASQGIDKGVMREAVVMQMTWVGAPTVYYGDEAGVCGFTDPDNRRTYPWGKEDQELLSFHKEAICIHKDNPVLTYGSTCFLSMEHQLLSYGRFDEENQIVVVVNNSREEREENIPVWKASVPPFCTMERLMLTLENGFSTNDAVYGVRNGILYLKLPPVCSMILKTL